MKERIDKFVTQLGQPLTDDLIDKITGAVEETSPVLSGFDLFNQDCFDKSTETRQEHFEVLVNHYGTSTTDDFENDVTKTLPLINADSALTEYDGFMESFDASVEVLNEKLKKKVKDLAAAQKLKSSEVSCFMANNKPVSPEVYRLMHLDGSLALYPNIAKLFKLSLLIPPSTSNVERGFSVMNLLCTPLQSLISEHNLDCFVRLCINGPPKFTKAQLNDMVDIFKRTCDNRCISL